MDGVDFFNSARRFHRHPDGSHRDWRCTIHFTWLFPPRIWIGALQLICIRVQIDVNGGALLREKIGEKWRENLILLPEN